MPYLGLVDVCSCLPRKTAHHAWILSQDTTEPNVSLGQWVVFVLWVMRHVTKVKLPESGVLSEQSIYVVLPYVVWSGMTPWCVWCAKEAQGHTENRRWTRTCIVEVPENHTLWNRITRKGPQRLHCPCHVHWDTQFLFSWLWANMVCLPK